MIVRSTAAIERTIVVKLTGCFAVGNAWRLVTGVSPAAGLCGLLARLHPGAS